MNRLPEKLKSIDFRPNSHFPHLRHNMNSPSTSKTVTLNHFLSLSAGICVSSFYVPGVGRWVYNFKKTNEQICKGQK